jgi:hypothetical protein
MKRQAEAAEEVAQVAQVEPVEEGPSHRFKVVDPANLIVGQQYRIHVNGTSYERDRLGIYISRDPGHNFPVFDKINRVTPRDVRIFSHDALFRFSPETCTFFESGKTIKAHKVFEPRGLPPQLLNGYGGSRPVKRRTVRRRRIHRTVKRRHVAI